MKLIKVQSRWKLHTAGMAVALRFDHWCPEAQDIEEWLRLHYGQERMGYTRGNAWKSHWPRTAPSRSRPYFVGLCNEELATVLLVKFAK